MAKLVMMMFDGCPYCAKAKKWVAELKAENPAYAAVEIQEVDERLHPEYYKERKLNYYYVPTYYLCDNQGEPVQKLFEGAPEPEDIKKVLDAAVAVDTVKI